MIISINASKTFGKVRHLFIIKFQNKLGIERTDLSTIEAICTNPQSIVTKRRKAQRIYFVIWKAWRILMFLFHTVYKGLARAIRQESHVCCNYLSIRFCVDRSPYYFRGIQPGWKWLGPSMCLIWILNMRGKLVVRKIKNTVIKHSEQNAVIKFHSAFCWVRNLVQRLLKYFHHPATPVYQVHIPSAWGNVDWARDDVMLEFQQERGKMMKIPK